MGLVKSLVQGAKAFGGAVGNVAQKVTDDFGQTVVNVTEGQFGGTTTEERARRRAAEGQAQLSAAEQARLAAEAQAKAAAEAEAKRQAQAQEYVTKAQLSPEQLAQMEQQRKASMGEGLMSEVIAQKQAKDADRQMKAMAMARGFNPMAARGSEYQSAEARANIQAQGRIAAEQEKAQALVDYSNMQQYQQQMQMAGEQAKKAFLMGNQEMQQQQEASMSRYQAALSEIQARKALADKQRESNMWGALLSGAATVGATLATGGNVAAGMAAGTATNALYQGTQR